MRVATISLCGLLMGSQGAAQPVIVSRIADTATIAPGAISPFQQFLEPAIDRGVVAFMAEASTMQGVYRGSGGPLTVVADLNTLSPGGRHFTGFGFVANWRPSIHGTSTSFQAGDGVEGGVFLRSDAGIMAVATTLIFVPNGNGGTFAITNSPVVESNRVVFAGSESGDNQKGVYSWENGLLSIIADRSTLIPGGTGMFTDFGNTVLRNGRVSFTALGVNQQGIYVSDSSGLHRRYDRATVVPAGNGGTFTNLGRGSLNDDGAMAFFGQGGDQEGIYTDLGGTLIKIANHDTPIPGHSGTFNGFGWVSMEDGLIAFVGHFGGGNRGTYTWENGVLSKVAAQGDILDGNLAFDINMGPQGLSGRSIALWVEFTNGAEGIYMATLPSSCYPDCNSDTALNLADFGCFQTRYALAQPYADCNGDGVRNLSDFGCFLTKFARGCP
ncbi:MAG: hypothetical protein IT437_08975 [Phycisphaerales bacterium]|nr:hypothetical protein [Phycisphaerales bacterium]